MLSKTMAIVIINTLHIKVLTILFIFALIFFAKVTQIDKISKQILLKMTNIELKPARVFEQFAKINAIPRPSKHEDKMIEYLVEFGKNHNLDTKVDKTGNVLITKPATKGMEDAPTVILQSHIDMVCDKLVDVDFDFHKDPIQTYIDGEWLTAKGTTLGADDGIGVAYELALLASDDIEHGKN